MLSLKKHALLAKQQTGFYKHKQENLKENEAILAGDFAENYGFVVQECYL